MVRLNLYNFNLLVLLKKSSLTAAFFSCLFFSPFSVAETDVYFFSNQFFYSDSISINEALGLTKKGDYQNGDKAVGYSEIGMTTNLDNWQLSISKVEASVYTYHPETAEFLYLTNNQLDLPDNQIFNLQLNINKYSAYKYSIGRQFFKGSTFTVKPSYSLLQMQSYTNGVITGTANTNTNNDYDFQFNSNYNYTSDPLFGRDTSTTLAYGHSVDIETNWQINQKLKSIFIFKNAFSYVNWPQLPHSNINATNTTKTTDANGYLLYLPNISGKEDFVDQTQTLIPSSFASLNYSINQRWNIELNYLKFDIFEDGQIRTTYITKENNLLTLGVGVNTKSIILGFNSDKLLVNIQADHFDLNKAHTLGFILSYRLTF